MTQSYNKDFSAYLQKALKEKKVKVTHLMEMLSLSKESVYRRIRGDADFTFTEMTILQNIFGFSMDSFNPQYQAAGKLFHTKNFPILATPLLTIENYVTQLYNDLFALHQAGVTNLYYAAKDLPLFCFFAHATLIPFKLYFWYITLFDDNTKETPYDEKWLPKHILDKATDLYHLYCKTPSVEIWNYETMNSTSHQIDYCLQTGLLKPAQAANLQNALQQFVGKLEDNCIQQSKNGQASFTMYLNEILLLDNSVLFEVGPQKIFYLSYQTLNFLYTTDQQFALETHVWFAKQIRKSTLLSGTAQRDRTRLMNHYREVIQNVSNI